MKKIVCDKCKNETAHIVITVILASHNAMGLPAETDLCIFCTALLINWLKEKPTDK